MIGKKLVALLSVAVLGAGLAASPAMARKKCKKLCRENIAACREANCKPLPNHRRKCNRTCKRDIIQICKSRPDTTTCSPSGAFLDSSTF
jgi:hypothetical protein